MPLFENHVGVSVSSSKLRLVELIFSNNEFYAENVDEVDFREVLDPSDFNENSVNVLRSALNKLISQNNLKSNFVSFCLDPEFFEIIEVPYENTLLKNDLTDQFRWELSKLRPSLNPEDYLIQSIELQKTIYKRENQAAILFLHKNILRSLKNISVESNLELKYVDYSHTSANLFFKVLKVPQTSEGISILKSEGCISVIYLSDLKPAAVIKKRYSNGEFENVIEKVFMYLQQQEIDLPKLSFAYYCSDDISESELSDIEHQIHFTPDVINPFKSLNFSDNFSSKVDITKNSSRFASAAGVALRLL